MKYLKFLLLLLVCIFAANFAGHNNQYVKIDLFPIPVEFEMVLFAIILAALLVGVLLGGTVAGAKASYYKIKYRRAIKEKNASQS